MGTEIDSLDERMEQLDRFLVALKDKFKLSAIKLPELDLAESISSLRRLSPEDIWQKHLDWKYYVLAADTLLNDIKAKQKWIEYTWAKYTGIQQRHVDKAYGYKVEDRVMMLLETDAYAERLYKIKMDLDIELTQIGNTVVNINYLAETAKQIALDKRRAESGNYRN